MREKIYKPKKKFMELAIKEAGRGKKNNEWFFGAVIVKNNRVVVKSNNTVLRNNDPSGHAEISAMRKAGKKLKSKYLTDCILYSTHEPWCMCAGAAVWADMKGIVFGANVKDLEQHFNKSGIPIKFYISAQEIIKRKYPRNIFLIKNFMRKECKELFKLYK